MDVEALLRPVIEAEGFELYDLTRAREAGRTVLRVIVDGPEGIDIDTLGRLSGLLSRRLDDAGYESGPYELQVTSPGIERPLRRPEHFRGTVGEQVKVKTRAPLAGTRIHIGTLVEADDEAITLAIGDHEVRVSLTDIASARTIVDWSAELKRSNA